MPPVAEHHGLLYGSWSAAQYQGSIAGMNAAGAGAEFGGIPRSNTLKVLGVDLLSVGKFEPDDASFLVLEQESGGRYFRFVFRDGLLVGAILLGDTSVSPALKKAIETRADFTGLLSQRPAALDVRARLAEAAVPRSSPP
jgi:nitrite reductase (NADH) large subunit